MAVAVLCMALHRKVGNKRLEVARRYWLLPVQTDKLTLTQQGEVLLSLAKGLTEALHQPFPGVHTQAAKEKR